MTTRDYAQMADVAKQHHRHQRKYLFRLFLKQPLAIGSALVLILSFFCAIFAPWVAPFPEQGQGRVEITQRLKPPSDRNLFGTDTYGRDILSRVIYGARISLFGSLIVVSASVLIGVPIGLWAGYKEGFMGQLVMRVVEMFLSFPALLVAIIIAALGGAGITVAIIALIIPSWTGYARLVEGEVLSVKQNLYVEAAQMLGYDDGYIIFRHLLPNIISPVIVMMVLDLGPVIISIGAMSWLGLGTQPPMADWGLMLYNGTAHILSEWWIPIFPGLALTIVVVAINLFGDTLQELLDPRRRP